MGASVGFLQKAQCSIGLHAGNFEYRSGYSCEKTRRCPHCDAITTITSHQWGSWELDEAACSNVSTCTRCSEKKTKDSHDYDWYFSPSASNPCAYEKRCVRCDHKAFFGSSTRHSWGSWQLSPVGDGSARVCDRCGAVDEKKNTPPTPSSNS
jgi:hypothetical protein